MSNSLLGKSITTAVIQNSFFKHFCASTDEKGLEPALARLKKANIGAILDYAAENDVESSDSPSIVNVERVYDANLETTLNAIRAAKQTGKFAAVKMSSLADPLLLQSLSHHLKSWEEKFIKLLPSSVSATSEHFLEKKAFLQKFPSQEEIFDRMDVTNSGKISLFDLYGYFLSVRDPSRPASNFLFDQVELLSSKEMQAVHALLVRVRKLASVASENSVTCMMDAEQTYLQPAIDFITIQVMSEFNLKYAVLFNTYQAYLRDTRQRLNYHLKLSQLKSSSSSKNGWFFGAKLVRGAYMVLERKRSQTLGLADPICYSIQETHESYNTCANDLFSVSSEIPVSFMAATHNISSIKMIAEKEMELRSRGVPINVSFGQLYGMCDYISYNLADAGCNVLKYVPYGPVQEVLPYLIRRAEENSDILSGEGGVKKELELLKQEILRRIRVF
jgi:proline dehydrogenase